MKYLFMTIILAVTGSFAQKSPQAKVKQGLLEGLTLPSGISAYRGIPFAAPPVGELRWKAPQPPANWTGVRKATQFGNRPMQNNVFGDMVFRSAKMSEDCLYLNIWTPARKTDAKLPVLVYFYGGGFIAGDGSENRYDGEALAKKGIVTVTVNYRLGIFGFLAHPELTAESPNHASGNYGLLDQNAALVWVKENIAAFGGNPNHITIGGESAGSISVSAQMASPLSKDLISGAIGQSGAMIEPTLDAIPLDENEKYGEQFTNNINLHGLKDLRSISAELLLESTGGRGFQPRASVDGYFLQKKPSEIFAAGEQAKVPLLAGWTSVEMPYMYLMGDKYPNPENYRQVVQERFGKNAEEILDAYRGKNEEEVIAVATALAGDVFIAYSTWKWADMHRMTAGSPTYLYIFAKPRPDTPGAKNDNGGKPAPPKGANHSADLEYLLGNLATNKVFPWTADDYKVSRIGVDYLANFIKTGNPNGKDLPEWPISNPEGEMDVMTIDVKSASAKEAHRNRYEALERFYSHK